MSKKENSQKQVSKSKLLNETKREELEHLREELRSKARNYIYQQLWTVITLKLSHIRSVVHRT